MRHFCTVCLKLRQKERAAAYRRKKRVKEARKRYRETHREKERLHKAELYRLEKEAEAALLADVLAHPGKYLDRVPRGKKSLRVR